MAHSHALESSTLTTTQSSVQTARKIVDELCGPSQTRDFHVRYWDGTVEGPTSGRKSRFTIELKRPGALRRMLLPPSDLALGEAYLRDDFAIEGNMEAATGLADTVAGRMTSPLVMARVVPKLRSLPEDD